MTDAEEYHKRIYENIRDAYASSDMEGRLVGFNEAFRALLGYGREELLTMRYVELTPERWHSLEAHIVRHQVVVRGFSEIYVKEYRRKDGTVFPVELQTTLIRDQHGKPAEMLAMVRDISSRVQMQQDLHRSREEYRTLAENSPDLLLRLDRDFRHIYANSAAARTVGLSGEQLTGRTLFQIGLPDPIARTWQQRIATVFDTGEPSQLEDVMPCPSGTRHFDYRLVPEFDPDGLLCCVLVIGRDITERKCAEQALLLASEELEKRVAERTRRLATALREQESFSYSVSHDLRAPLRHINSYLAILAEDFGGLLPEEAHALLSRTRTASGRMGKLIDDLLELARVSRTNLVKEQVDLGELAVAAVENLRETSPRRSAEFLIGDALSVQGDRSLLAQMLENLLGNAWKYTAGNPHALIEFGKEVVADQEVFYIRDNGVGFDMAYSDKLFGAFQRLHGPEYEGNGIGLATVKRIVDRHGGRVWATSRPDEGATFYFMLP